jgi:hypothetical protein
MAFTLKNLENHSGSGAGLKVYSYSTGDNKAAVKGTGYFNDAAGLLDVGSRILIHASDADFDCHVSAISGAGVVTIAAIDAFA